MLKYELRTNTLGDDRYELNLFSIACYVYYADADKVEVRSIYTNDFSLYEGANVTVVSTIDKEDDFGGTFPVTEVDNVSVAQCDNINKTFSFISDKYQYLTLNSVTIEVEDNNMYLHFYFDAWHYFRTWENYGITFYVKFVMNDGTEKIITFEGCQVVTDTELKWRYDVSTENLDNFMCSVFRNDKYEFAGYGEYNEEVDAQYIEVDEIPETACFTDELYLKKKETHVDNPSCWRWVLYEKQCNDGTLFNISVYRLNYKFKDVNHTTEYVLVPLVSVNVPMSVESGYDLYKEQNINEKFVEIETEAAKNKTVEMEKLTYHPVFKTINEQTRETTYFPIHKIKFNLHFRQREKDGWVVKQDGYWNGVPEEGSLVDNSVYGNNFKFFSYNTDTDLGHQSDLLCYLGFNDSDVKYQKSRLKKSFLRLSFYDSMNRADQNLLCYSTIYLDSGEIFAKMMRGANRKITCSIQGEEDRYEVKDLYVVSGQTDNMRYADLRVDREPCFCSEESDNEKVEKYRLSSQISVTDMLGKKCAEGFYLYLWADNDNGAIPSDIYMRVEFNHAGYGRVIPFTMPYDSNGICTFESIMRWWKEGVMGADGETHIGWGVRTNERFSYIHFKYVYDSENRRHVYYLDDDTYNMDTCDDTTPDELEINLYESKINFD